MNMSSNLSYTQTGDYLLPNLTLHQPKTPLGKYGRLRRTYLKEHRPVLYNSMLLNGSLYPHLMEDSVGRGRHDLSPGKDDRDSSYSTGQDLQDWAHTVPKGIYSVV